MEGADAASWAPQSPDLSTYYSADPEPVHPQHQGYRGSVSHALPYSPPGSSPRLAHHAAPVSYPPNPGPPGPMPRRVKKENEVVMQDPDYLPDDQTEKSRGKRPQTNNGTAGDDSPTALPSPDNMTIKNHFPVARIKRIMQADDDVGKVAQVTPVVVSKALELFMISLVTKAAAEAKGRNSKRVAPAHLKQVVVKNEQFDFLSDIVSKVADAPAPADKSANAMDVDGKRRKTPARKRKKVEEEDF